MWQIVALRSWALTEWQLLINKKLFDEQLKLLWTILLDNKQKYNSIIANTNIATCIFQIHFNQTFLFQKFLASTYCFVLKLWIFYHFCFNVFDMLLLVLVILNSEFWEHTIMSLIDVTNMKVKNSKHEYNNFHTTNTYRKFSSRTLAKKACKTRKIKFRYATKGISLLW